MRYLIAASGAALFLLCAYFLFRPRAYRDGDLLAAKRKASQGRSLFAEYCQTVTNTFDRQPRIIVEPNEAAGCA